MNKFHILLPLFILPLFTLNHLKINHNNKFSLQHGARNLEIISFQP